MCRAQPRACSEKYAEFTSGTTLAPFSANSEKYAEITSGTTPGTSFGMLTAFRLVTLPARCLRDFVRYPVGESSQSVERWCRSRTRWEPFLDACLAPVERHSRGRHGSSSCNGRRFSYGRSPCLKAQYIQPRSPVAVSCLGSRLWVKICTGWFL